MQTPKKKPSDRISELKEVISGYSYEYHVNDNPVVSDAIYDGLFSELKELEAENPELITPDSPTQRVGNELKGGFQKVEHQTRMLSLNDVFSAEDVKAWFNRVSKLTPGVELDFFADVKMDGLACSLVYEDGVLVRAVTRGDSFIGEDVTSNVRTIKNIPLKLRYEEKNKDFHSGRTEIRGEIVILKSDFERINQKQRELGLEEFKNPRNLAAGTIRQLDPKLAASRPLTFIAYDIIPEDKTLIKTWVEAYDFINSLGIRRNSQAQGCENIAKVMDFIQYWDKLRHDLPFNTDGLVVKINNRKIYEDLGVVGKQPRAAVAYKYAAEQATSVLEDIVISIGRTGAATPVAIFEPVQIAGTTVKHASLHNADEIERLDVRRGDTVVIYKAGDIIPKVESVILDLRPKNSVKIDFEEELKRQYPELQFEKPEGEVLYRLKDFSGSMILKKNLEHYASKSALDINTLGSKNVEALVDSGLVEDIADIYSLTVSDLLKLERFAEISAKKLINAIQDSKQPKLERFLYALGIRHIGSQTAKDIVKEFHSIDKIKNADLEDYLNIDGIGEVVAESIVAWFVDEDNQKLLDKFEKLGVNPQYKQSNGVLNGVGVAVTGTLESMGRSEFADYIQSFGAEFHATVNKNTKYLVYGGKIGDSKRKKAEKLGTEIISEEEFSKNILNLKK